MAPIGKQKKENLEKKMFALKIKEADLCEKFIKGQGSGGQKINKTASCVYLKHIPSGVEVKCQKSRFLQENRFFARRILALKIEAIQAKEDSEKARMIAKLKKQKKKRTKKTKAKLLKLKQERSEKKKFRSQKIDLD